MSNTNISVSKGLLLFAVSCLVSLYASSQQLVPGCTDVRAVNYNASAKKNDGSCQYAKTSYKPEMAFKLPVALQEISGMVFWNGQIWAINDGGNPTHLYGIEMTTGKIKQVVILSGTSNHDWEELTQDSMHFYVGDFGNNSAGNRKDLQVLKIPKTAITNADTVIVPAGQIGRIQFRYADQEDFNPVTGNQTQYDCEAFTWLDGKLHLFTKNWMGTHSVHYVLPTTPGDFVAERKDSMETGAFKITGMAAASSNELVFTSYTRDGKCALFIVFGFSNPDRLFADANRRIIKLPGAVKTGQLESVCFYDRSRGWLSSERLKMKGVKVPEKVMRFNWAKWVGH